MAGDEDEAQQVIADGIINRGIEIWHRHLFGLELVTEFLVLALEPLVSAERVNGTVLGGSHEPCAGIIRNTPPRPFFDRHNQRVLGKRLGNAKLSSDPP